MHGRLQPHLQAGVQVFHGVVHEGALLPLSSAVCNITIPTSPLFEMVESFTLYCVYIGFPHVCVTGQLLYHSTENLLVLVQYMAV